MHASTQNQAATHDDRPRPQPKSRVDRRKRLRAVFAEELIGWCGAAALLTAFGLSAVGVLPASSASYLVLNLFGAVGLAYASLSRQAYPPAVLNMIWAVVAACSLLLLISRV